MEYSIGDINSKISSCGAGGYYGASSAGANIALDDLFSASEFDAVKFINARFPDEKSLEDLDRFVVGITARIGAVDEASFVPKLFYGVMIYLFAKSFNIFKNRKYHAQCNHSLARANRLRRYPIDTNDIPNNTLIHPFLRISSWRPHSQDIQDAQVAIMELFANISSIKTQASQSERMVQEICADIKRLDYAKTHLQTTITSLKRLQMLITAVTQLEVSFNGRNRSLNRSSLLRYVSP
jgi:hypothetical protein